MMKPARIGRAQQRYEGEKKAVRLITGCVPIVRNQIEGDRIVVVTSSKRDGWVLPKGGWENDESSEEGAAREAYEEAGVTGVISSSIGTFSCVSRKGKQECAVMYVLEVEKVLDIWPECRKRQRKLVPIDEVCDLLIRPEQRDMISVLKTAPAKKDV